MMFGLDRFCVEPLLGCAAAWAAELEDDAIAPDTAPATLMDVNPIKSRRSNFEFIAFRQSDFVCDIDFVATDLELPPNPAACRRFPEESSHQGALCVLAFR